MAALAATIAALLGVALGLLGGAASGGYGLVMGPFTAVLAALGIQWRRGRRGGLVAGAVAAVVAFAVAIVLAVGRLRYSGATGLPTVASLLPSRELQMLVGVLPGVAILGVGSAARWSKWASVLGGALVSLAMGPVSIGLVALAAVPWLGPPVPTVVVIAVVAILDWRQRRLAK